MSTTGLTLEYLGTFWQWSGDLAYLTHPDGRQARIYVDSLGETWVDVRVKPEGGYFHSERVDCWRSFSGAERAVRILTDQGFGNKRSAQYAHRVVERDL